MAARNTSSIRLLVQQICIIGAMALIVAGCGQTPVLSPTVSSSSTTATENTTQATLAPTNAVDATSETAGTPDVIKIVFSGLPSTSPDPMKFRLEQADFKACAGKFTIQYEMWDHSSSEAGSWDIKKETQNAHNAATDPDVMIYLGPLFSGAAKASIPILNRADVVMISPFATLSGLTKPDTGEPGEPDVYYPTGTRNFARVTPSDDIQGAVGAVWAEQIGAHSVYIVNENSIYSKTLARVFDAKAQALGLTIAGSETYNKTALRYEELAQRIVVAKPELLYIAGVTNVATFLKDVREAGYTGPVMGPDLLYNDSVLAQFGPLAEGLYVTIGTIPAKELTGKGKEFYDQYKAAFAFEPEPHAALYYETMSVALAGIEKVCAKDRAAIRAAIMGTKDFDGVLGKWSFDVNGDTSLTTMSGLQVKDGKYTFVKLLSERE